MFCVVSTEWTELDTGTSLHQSCLLGGGEEKTPVPMKASSAVFNSTTIFSLYSNTWYKKNKINKSYGEKKWLGDTDGIKTFG